MRLASAGDGPISTMSWAAALLLLNAAGRAVPADAIGRHPQPRCRHGVSVASAPTIDPAADSFAGAPALRAEQTG